MIKNICPYCDATCQCDCVTLDDNEPYGHHAMYIGPIPTELADEADTVPIPLTDEQSNTPPF